MRRDDSNVGTDLQEEEKSTQGYARRPIQCLSLGLQHFSPIALGFAYKHQQILGKEF